MRHRPVITAAICHLTKRQNCLSGFVNCETKIVKLGDDYGVANQEKHSVRPGSSGEAMLSLVDTNLRNGTNP